MERDTKKRHLPFLTAHAKARQLYALDMNRDDFVEMAYDVWRDIGNIATKLTRYFVKVPNDYIVELPSQCEFIDSVTLSKSSRKLSRQFGIPSTRGMPLE